MRTFEQMVEEFQCPGCVHGGDTHCHLYKPSKEMGKGGMCEGHVLGTMLGLGNSIALGLPKGFNKPGYDYAAEPPRAKTKMRIRLWTDGTKPKWDHLNVPVWYLERDGLLFVRTFMPRINLGIVDVIDGGSSNLVPNAIDVAEFLDEID